MGRLSEELVSRAETFGDRMLDVVEALDKKRVYRRILDQMVGCGTSVGANACEADQAVSRKDFCKSLGTVLKELGESRYWIRVCCRRGWVRPQRLDSLQNEALELGKIFGSMVVRSRRGTR